MPQRAWSAKRERQYALHAAIPSGPGGRTKEQLYNEAKEREVSGRSSMSKAELERTLARRERRN